MSAVQKLPELISAKDIAEYLDISERHFSDRISKTPDFPNAIKIGQRRQWVKSEFTDWLMKQREI